MLLALLVTVHHTITHNLTSVILLYISFKAFVFFTLYVPFRFRLFSPSCSQPLYLEAVLIYLLHFLAPA